MQPTIPAIYLPILGTLLFLALGCKLGKSQSEWDCVSGIIGISVFLVGTLLSWMIYFMVLYFSKT